MFHLKLVVPLFHLMCLLCLGVFVLQLKTATLVYFQVDYLVYLVYLVQNVQFTSRQNDLKKMPFTYLQTQVQSLLEALIKFTEGLLCTKQYYMIQSNCMDLVLSLLQWSKLRLVVVVQPLSCAQLCDSINCHVPGFPVLHYLPEFAQTCPLSQ